MTTATQRRIGVLDEMGFHGEEEMNKIGFLKSLGYVSLNRQNDKGG